MIFHPHNQTKHFKRKPRHIIIIIIIIIIIHENPHSLYTVLSESRCALIKVVESDVHKASIQAWNLLILFTNTFHRSVFGKSLCTYKRCWKWCPRVSVQAWTCLIIFKSIFCRSECGKSLCAYKICWKWCPWTSIQARTCLHTVA
jgi:hypothetical protein